MRRFLILLIVVLSSFLAQSAEARKLALLIGVDEYINVKSLHCCVNDMKLLKESLLKIGFEEENIEMLVTGGAYRDLPTKERIEQKLSEMLSKADVSDMVFIAFSGHGMQKGNTTYFCTPDVELDDLDGTCISVTKVMNDLAQCSAQFKWVVVDACRNDPASTRAARGMKAIPDPPSGIALFQSCAKGEWSYEESRVGGNGYFTKNLAAALSGEADADNDGKLTLFEVCKWTTEHTKAEVLKAEKETQRPYLSGSSPNFILVNDPNVPKAKALVEQARQATKAEDYELAIKKYDEALALCPRLSYVKDERDSAEQLLDAKNRREAAEKHDLSIPGKTAGERKTISIDGVEFAFRWCPPGTFLMGSPTGEAGKKELNSIYEGKDFEKIERQRKIKLTKGFWMLETEVTVGMFKTFFAETGYLSQGNVPIGYSDNKMERNSKYSWRNPGFTQDDSHPVTCVSWIDASAFCEWLSKKTGVKIQLPTEAQWEYACRAGSITALPNGDIEIKGEYNAPALDSIAWYGGNCSQGFTGQSGINSSKWKETQYPGGPCGTHPVGKKNPNAWGLYDTIGNVCEWCADKFYPNIRGYETDPIRESSSSNVSRTIRGGSWDDASASCRSASRFPFDQDARIVSLGFRIAAMANDVESENQPLYTLSTFPKEGKKAGERAVIAFNGVEFAFRWCPPGKYDACGRSGGRYPVKLSKGFWMQETEVTQKQWEAIMGSLPRFLPKGDDLPVYNVSWDDCQEFCQKCKELGFPVQLPTEVQWEYACRADNNNEINDDELDDMAWYELNSDRYAPPVGKKLPNAWGLYDMLGNVWEWCQDSAGADYDDEADLYHAIRGGCTHSFDINGFGIRKYVPGYNSSSYVIADGPVGFRVLKSQ